MSATNAIYNKLTTTSAISAIVSDRVYPQAVPQGEAFPMIVYWEENLNVISSYTGATDLRLATMEVVGIAATYDGMKALAAAISAAFDNTSGTWGTTVVQGSFIQDTSEDKEAIPDTGSDDLYHTCSFSVTLWFKA